MGEESAGVRFGADTPVVLIGAGVMSATLGALIRELAPATPIVVLERLDRAAAESSDAWNNAGTGHSAFCELNYTPERADGSIDITKAAAIAEAFELSKQLWSYLVARGVLPEPASFIRRIPHMSFVWGEPNIAFLRRRHAALSASPLFASMRYSEDPAELTGWMPLVMEGRDPAQPVAATRVDIGTDVNFGALTRGILEHLCGQPDVALHYNHEVRWIERDGAGWRVDARDLASGRDIELRAAFVFIGAGGGSLPLLLRSGIPEGRGYGGFPVSGQWLVCKDPALAERHAAKVYGRAEVGAPPMSVPHLDTRFIDGRRALFFGPFAGFSTKFLKHGSVLDLPLSMRINNVIPMLAVGMHNIPLTKYLIEQVAQSPEDRLAALRAYLPLAQIEDWELQVAGQRVQVIKGDAEEGGVLEFGTEVVSAADGTLAALLGASPGASTAASIMLGLLARCAPATLGTPDSQVRLAEIFPSYGRRLADDPELCARVREQSGRALGILPEGA